LARQCPFLPLRRAALGVGRFPALKLSCTAPWLTLPLHLLLACSNLSGGLHSKQQLLHGLPAVDHGAVADHGDQMKRKGTELVIGEEGIDLGEIICQCEAKGVWIWYPEGGLEILVTPS